MKKSDLKTGMIVELRNGKMYLVMLNPDCEDRELISLDGGFMSLCDYEENLRWAKSFDDQWTVVKIYSLENSICFILSEKEEALKNKKLIWERKGIPVEMTIAEIEEKLGIKNLRIIKEG